MGTPIIIKLTGSGTYEVPFGINSFGNEIDCVGPGGNSGPVHPMLGSGGGGGGGYTRKASILDTYMGTIQHYNANAPEGAWFGGTGWADAIARAERGQDGQNGGVGGLGGNRAASVGYVNAWGGTGGIGNSAGSGLPCTGGGGGGAGGYGPGGTSTGGGTGPAGETPPPGSAYGDGPGGDGGNGGTTTVRGGGGGGSNDGGNGQNGDAGGLQGSPNGGLGGLAADGGPGTGAELVTNVRGYVTGGGGGGAAPGFLGGPGGNFGGGAGGCGILGQIALGGEGLIVLSWITAMQITPAVLPIPVQEDVPYTAQLTAHYGYAPYTWTVTAGTLPPGLTLHNTLGTISGTPESSGTYNFTVQAADSGNSSIYPGGTPNTATMSYTMVVLASPFFKGTGVPKIIWEARSPSTTKVEVFDFRNQLQVGATIVSATIDVVVVSGVDTSPSAIKKDPLVINGPTVRQMYWKGRSGVTYGNTCHATTSTDEVLELFAFATVVGK